MKGGEKGDKQGGGGAERKDANNTSEDIEEIDGKEVEPLSKR